MYLIYNFKTILTKVSIFFVLSTFFAKLATADEKIFSGLYLGIEIGSSRAYTSSSLKDTGVISTQLLGYRLQSDRGIVIGIEQFAGKAFNHFNGYVDNKFLDIVDTGRLYGFDGVLGYTFNKALVFISVGYSNIKCKINLDGLGSKIDGSLRYGGGIEISLHKNISGRIKITKANYEQDGGKLKNTTATLGIIVQF